MKKNIKLGLIVFGVVSVLSPKLAYAVASTGGSSGLLSGDATLKTLISGIITIMSSIVPLLIGAAVVFFLYGVLVFIVKSSSGNADGRKEGRNFMVFGIIGIAVMVSVWGLVMFVTASLGTNTAVPQFNSSGTSGTPASSPYSLTMPS